LTTADGLRYRLESTAETNLPNGVVSVFVYVEQGPYRIRLNKQIIIVPTRDQVVLDDGVGPDWTLEHSARIDADLTVRSPVFEGEVATALTARASRLGGWNVEFTAPEPIDPAGFAVLRFAIHPGDLDPADTGTLRLVLEGAQVSTSAGPGRHTYYEGYERIVDLLAPGPHQVDLRTKEWQEVEVSLAALDVAEPIAAIRFVGTLAGTFYVDDLRLPALPLPTSTAVVEDRTQPAAGPFALEQNRPNPFNSQTTVRFVLPAESRVELSVYNTTGQRVATLVRGERPAGAYVLDWDGRTDDGRPLATGVYLYRLRAGSQVQVRKLLLLR
jgi:hypothetical protein